MRHLKTARLPGAMYVTDPATGKAYPIPAGGADDDGGASDSSDADNDADADSDSDDDGSDADADDDGDDDSSDDDTLGPAGEKALRAMKKRARAAERELRKLKASQQDDSQGGDGDGQPDADEIRKQIRAEVDADLARDRALDKVETKAARKFQNPELARKLLADQADDFLDETGKPDVEAINEALDELLEDEPYLAAQGGQKWQGGSDGGARKDPPKPEPKPGLDRLRHAYQSTK